MKAVVTIIEEIYGLFVDDGSYALCILGWVAVAAFLFRRLPIRGGWQGVALFAGLAAIVLVSAVRTAKRQT